MSYSIAKSLMVVTLLISGSFVYEYVHIWDSFHEKGLSAYHKN